MSKYSLKLEQLVQTTSLGDILVTIQYDGEGPKLVSASGDSLSPELKHLLDTVLGLVNFALAKKIAPVEIAEQLEISPHDGVKLEIDDVLVVIAQALKEAPNSIQQISPDSLMQIMPEMIREITQGINHAGDEEYTTKLLTSSEQHETQPLKPEMESEEEVEEEEEEQSQAPTQPQAVEENVEENIEQDNYQTSAPTQPVQTEGEDGEEEQNQQSKTQHEKGGFFGGFGGRN